MFYLLPPRKTNTQKIIRVLKNSQAKQKYVVEPKADISLYPEVNLTHNNVVNNSQSAFSPLNNVPNGHYPHFTEQETEAQRGKVTCLI